MTGRWLVVAGLAWAGTAGAQALPGTGASLGVRERFGEDGWVTMPTMALALDERRGPWTLVASGHVDAPLDGIAPSRRVVGTAAMRSGSLTWRGIDASAGLGAARRQHGPVEVRTEITAMLHLRREGSSSGAWLDVGRTRAGRSQPGITEGSAGWWMQRGDFRVGVVGRSTQFRAMLPVGPDSSHAARSQCVEEYDPSRPRQQYRTMCPVMTSAGAFGLRAAWQRHATAVEAVVMREVGHQVMGESIVLTGELRLVRRLAEQVALDIGMARQPADPARSIPAHAAISAGIQVLPRRAPAAVLRPAPPPVLASRDGMVLNLGDAQMAEVQGDFTGWRPEPLERLGGGRWRYAGALSAGPHSLMVRIDGGRWHAPAGLPTSADGFGGVVGVVVVR